MSQWLRSPLTRLAWQLPVVTSLILIAVLVPMYREAVSDIEGEVRNAISEEVIGLRQVYDEQGIAGLSRAVEARMHAAIDRPAVYLLTDRAGRRVAGADMPWPDVPLRNDQWFRIPEAHGDTLDGKVFILDGGHRLLVARRSPLKAFRTRLSGRLALAAVLAFVGSLSIAGWTLGRYRARMAQIQHGAREILGGELSRRLRPGGYGDELDQLALEFNQAFAEIEKLMEATRHVSSAIAHDMRRPIAAIRYRLEELSRRPELPETTRDDIAALLEQTDESLNTFAALLRLARLESGSYGPKKERVELQHLLREVVETYAPVAVAHDMKFTSELAPAAVIGDWNLLFSGLQNLVDNAINYGSERIDALLRVQGDQAVIQIRDYGAGVPTAALPHLFERFYRADAARSGSGAGIGLALVRAIVEVHGGVVEARNTEPGLVVEIRLPLALP